MFQWYILCFRLICGYSCRDFFTFAVLCVRTLHFTSSHVLHLTFHIFRFTLIKKAPHYGRALFITNRHLCAFMYYLLLTTYYLLEFRRQHIKIRLKNFRFAIGHMSNTEGFAFQRAVSVGHKIAFCSGFFYQCGNIDVAGILNCRDSI
jgi:hypothetical protein